MGGSERYTLDYHSIEFGGQIDADVTKDLPIADNTVEFIWSERMLEHINVHDISKVIRNICRILQKEGKARFCMASCFYLDNQSINMMRANNYPK